MAKSRLFIGYESAFWIWRKAGPAAFSALRPSRVRSLAGGAPTRASIRSFEADHPDLVLDALDLVVDYGDQRTLKGVNTHVRRTPLPERSFYRLDDGGYVASPELCLMQLATRLSEPQVVKLSLEMCGVYAIDPLESFDDVFCDIGGEDEQPGMVKRPSLTSAAKIEAYAKRSYAPGSKARGRHFTSYVVDGSASPRETALYMLLCMPVRFGGYGLAKPELNKRIELTLKERLDVGAHHYDCDLLWTGKKRVAVEYDSKLHHSAAEKQELDAIRRNMLQYKNVKVVVATRKQVNKPTQFDKLARQIGKDIGKRFRIPEKEHIAARDQLREVLLHWDVVDGRLL